MRNGGARRKLVSVKYSAFKWHRTVEEIFKCFSFILFLIEGQYLNDQNFA